MVSCVQLVERPKHETPHFLFLLSGWLTFGILHIGGCVALKVIATREMTIIEDYACESCISGSVERRTLHGGMHGDRCMRVAISWQDIVHEV